MITPGPVLRIAAFHLATKFCLAQACNLGEKCYEKLNFPIFQDFENMSKLTVGIFYQHFTDHQEAWKKEPFKKQLGFNRVLLKHNLQPLELTSIDLTTALTKTELETVKTLYEDKTLSKEQRTLLYNFHVGPEDHKHKSKSLPEINPVTANVDLLSDEQIRWHRRWFIQNYTDSVPQTQVDAYAQRFYALDLPPPHSGLLFKLMGKIT